MANFLLSTAAAGTTVSGSSDNDLVEFISGASSVTVKGFGGDDTLLASAGNVLEGTTFFANTGNDVLRASGISALTDGNFQFGKGNDSAVFGGGGSDIGSSKFKGKDGNDVITMVDDSGTASSIEMRGNKGDDTLTLGTLAGLNIDAATVAGGAGADTIDLTAAINASSIQLVGGLGEDAFDISGGTLEASDIILKSNTKAASLDSANTLTMVGVGYTTASIIGGGAADTINVNGGTWQEVTIRAGAGNDIVNLSGTNTTGDFGFGDGVDTVNLSNGVASSTVAGGAGNDIFVMSGVTTNRMIGGLGADDFSGTLAALTGNTFFYNTSTESTLTSRDTIDLLGNSIASGGTTGIVFGFDTAFGNVTAVSGQTLASGSIAGLATSKTVLSGTVVISAGDVDAAAGGTATVTAIAGFLDAGFTTVGESVMFTNTGLGGQQFLFVQKGDDDLIVELTNGAATQGTGGMSLVALNTVTGSTLTFG